MRWLAAAARFAAVSAAAYAVLSVWRAGYVGLLGALATPMLQFVGGLPHQLEWSGGSAQLLRYGDGRVPLGELPFLAAEWPIYLGLCAVTWRAAVRGPLRVVLGLAALLLLQAVALAFTAVMFCWRPGMSGLLVVQVVQVISMGALRVAPPALWWLQLGRGLLQPAAPRGALQPQPGRSRNPGRAGT